MIGIPCEGVLIPDFNPGAGLFLDIQIGRIAPGNGIIHAIVQFILGSRPAIFQCIERADKLVSGIVLDAYPDVSFFFGLGCLRLGV